MAKRMSKQDRINAVQRALGLPSISVAFNDALNKAAKAGEQEAIAREAAREAEREARA